MIMNASRCRSLFLLGMLIVLGLPLFAQSKAELQRRRDEINNKIAFTRKLIDESRQNQESTYSQLRILQEQIRYRQQLQRTYELEVAKINDDIASSERAIRELEARIEAMKKEYGAMVYQAYKGRRSHDELMYIFAADDFNQAFKRFKILQEYADYRKRQANEIRLTQERTQERIALLEADRVAKEALMVEKAKEAEALSADRAESERVLASLKSREQELRKQQQEQEAERQRINAAIRKIIEEELAAEKKKNDGRFELTPEGRIVSEQFEQNKGSLPWPVSRGVIVGRFGTQPHETLPGIVLENNGIDISTEAGTEVSAVFGGKVTTVFSIPGAGQNVIITHGAYKTVYTHLENVSVVKGDEVVAGQSLGQVMPSGKRHVAHLEIWKMTKDGGTPQNPELWISKR